MIRLQMFIFYATWILFLIILAVGYANYNYYGSYSLNLHIIAVLVKSYPFTTVLIILLLFTIIVYQYKAYREKIKNRKNCQITYVDLEKIAHLWLEYENIEDNIEHKIMEKMEISFDESKKDIQEVINTLIGNRSIKDMSFYKKYVFNYLDSFSKQELEIVAILYEILETKAKTLPSVATLYKKDTDQEIYSDTVSEKLTSYQILYKVNLFDHTLNVVQNMYDLLIKEKDVFVFNWSKMLICALSHDIGKIEKIESIRGLSSIDKAKYEGNTHENLSRLIISNAFPSYEYIDDVCEIIEKHHITSIDEKNKNAKLIKKLKFADQEARKQEIKNFLKNKKENKINETEEPKTEEPKAEEPKAEEPKTEEPKTEEPKAEEPKADIIEQKATIRSGQIIANQENFINPESLGNLIESISRKINIIEKTSRSERLKPISISEKDELYMLREVFVAFVKKAGIDTSGTKDYDNLLNKLKSDGVIKAEACLLLLENFGNAAYSKSKKEYISFSLISLGISPEEAELKKRNNEHLRNVIIKKGWCDE